MCWKKYYKPVLSTQLQQNQVRSDGQLSMQLHRGGPELRFREFRLKGIILVYKT